MKVKLLIVLTVLLGVSKISFSQSEVSSVEKAQALFIYNFSRHIGWPESSFNSNEFVIGIVGNKSLFQEITKISKDKLVGRYKIVVKFYNSADEAALSHMLVFGNKFNGSIEAYKSKMGSFPALIINTNESASNNKGDIIFKLVDQKMNYVVSSNTIKNKGLMMSKQLVNMAVSEI